mmetsp:Transcript_39082/g.94204  ORF Transcript_39082/g.94204 Transcript_39082/m.94204 type:complete len:352 (-) Transcript_39082:1209-2264(-)
MHRRAHGDTVLRVQGGVCMGSPQVCRVLRAEWRWGRGSLAPHHHCHLCARRERLEAFARASGAGHVWGSQLREGAAFLGGRLAAEDSQLAVKDRHCCCVGLLQNYSVLLSDDGFILLTLPREVARQLCEFLPAGQFLRRRLASSDHRHRLLVFNIFLHGQPHRLHTGHPDGYIPCHLPPPCDSLATWPHPREAYRGPPPLRSRCSVRGADPDSVALCHFPHRESANAANVHLHRRRHGARIKAFHRPFHPVPCRRIGCAHPLSRASVLVPNRGPCFLLPLAETLSRPQTSTRKAHKLHSSANDPHHHGRVPYEIQHAQEHRGREVQGQRGGRGRENTQHPRHGAHPAAGYG